VAAKNNDLRFSWHQLGEHLKNSQFKSMMHHSFKVKYLEILWLKKVNIYPHYVTDKQDHYRVLYL
jgi:hypothetical protein